MAGGIPEGGKKAPRDIPVGSGRGCGVKGPLEGPLGQDRQNGAGRCQAHQAELIPGILLFGGRDLGHPRGQGQDEGCGDGSRRRSRRVKGKVVEDGFCKNGQDQDDAIGAPEDIAQADLADDPPKAHHDHEADPHGNHDDHLPFADGPRCQGFDLGGQDLKIRLRNGDEKTKDEAARHEKRQFTCFNQKSAAVAADGSGPQVNTHQEDGKAEKDQAGPQNKLAELLARQGGN